MKKISLVGLFLVVMSTFVLGDMITDTKLNSGGGDIYAAINFETEGGDLHLSINSPYDTTAQTTSADRPMCSILNYLGDTFVDKDGRGDYYIPTDLQQCQYNLRWKLDAYISEIINSYHDSVVKDMLFEIEVLKEITGQDCDARIAVAKKWGMDSVECDGTKYGIIRDRVFTMSNITDTKLPTPEKQSKLFDWENRTYNAEQYWMLQYCPNGIWDNGRCLMED